MTIRTYLTWQEVDEIAMKLPSLRIVPGKTGTLLSVDWDFLSCPMPPTGNDRQKQAMYGMFSWQGDERLDALDSTRWWHEAAKQMKGVGLDIEACLPAHKSPSITTLRRDIGKINKNADAGLIAESHTWGAVAVRQVYFATNKPVDLISLDRHHDLGYKNPGHEENFVAAKEHMEKGASCDNWVWGALERGWIRSVTLVIPDKMWYDEYKVEPPMAPPHLLAKVQRMYYSEWVKKAPRFVDQVLIVRSAPWSPPWMDKDFAPFVQKAVPKGIWLDNDASLPRISAIRADEQRKWPITTAGGQ